MIRDLPRALYVHLPWCVRKCPYCDFNSHPQKGPLPTTAYVARLLDDLAADVRRAGPAPIATVFIGGGTPSLFPGDAIAALLDGVRARVSLAPDCEITLEANPGAVDESHFDAYASAGVNRLSIGAQSFAAGALERLGRIHGPAEIDRAVRIAKRAGFARINLDLMHGLPMQTVDAALDDIERAIDLDVEHLSWYQLTIEPRTPFAADPPPLPDERVLEAIEARGFERLAAAGYARYEISAFARVGAEARHNVNYWTFGDYVGVGAGAHGKLTMADGSIERTVKPLAPERYLKTPVAVLAARAPIDTREVPGEFMLNALRLIDGVDTATFESRTGLPIDVIAPEWHRQVMLGTMHDDRLALTPLGHRHLDTVVAAFL